MKTRPLRTSALAMFAHLYLQGKQSVAGIKKTMDEMFAVKIRARRYSSAGSGQPPDVWGRSAACKRMRLKNVRSGHVAHYRPRKSA